MNKRQFRKVLVMVAAKIAVKIKNPNLQISSTRAERKLVHRNKELVSNVVEEALKIYAEQERGAK